MTLGDLRTNMSWPECLSALLIELDRWGIRDYTLPTLRECQRTGSVTVSLARNGIWAYPVCGRFHSPEQNLRAITIAIEGARKAEQRGIGAVFAEVAKLAALPPGKRDPLEVLGLVKGRNYPESVLRAAYREKAKEVHPDHGGGNDALREVMEAAEELGVK